MFSEQEPGDVGARIGRHDNDQEAQHPPLAVVVRGQQHREAAEEDRVGLDEQAGKFVGRAGVGQVWRQQARRQKKYGFQRRNAI